MGNHRLSVSTNTALTSSLLYKLMLYSASFNVLEKYYSTASHLLQKQATQELFRRLNLE